MAAICIQAAPAWSEPTGFSGLSELSSTLSQAQFGDHIAPGGTATPIPVFSTQTPAPQISAAGRYVFLNNVNQNVDCVFRVGETPSGYRFRPGAYYIEDLARPTAFMVICRNVEQGYAYTGLTPNKRYFFIRVKGEVVLQGNDPEAEASAQ